jgi:hypothetical protein
MTIFLDSIDDATLAAAAVAAFGTGTHVLDKRFLGLGMSHVVYRILVDRPPGDCVFRFSRGTADTFDNEIANFAAVQRLTGVPGPKIYAVDKSCSHSATPFMVMEYLTGIEWQALCREDESQRDAVRWQVGEFYGRLHSETAPRSHKSNIILGIEQLADPAAEYLNLDRDAVLGCVETARRLIAGIDTYVLCFSDGELYFCPAGDGNYQPAFVLDLQWMQHDLALLDICAHVDDHFLRGYRRTSGIDVDVTLLDRLAVCRELSSWGFIATEAASRTRIPWIQSQRPRITDIMDAIQRAR